MTQAEMARRLGVSQSVVSKYEAGDRELGFLEIEAICHELGISLRTFIRRWRSVAADSSLPDPFGRPIFRFLVGNL